MRKILLLLTLVLTGAFAFAQKGSIKGTLVDKETGEGLFSATVIIEGTTNGATSNFDGVFTIGNVDAGSRKIVISFLGYENQTVDVVIKEGEVTDLGVIKLVASAIGLQEVEVIASIGIDRKTPVAMSNVKASEIETKLGNKEFPEILQSTPGVYTNTAGGGFGDAEITLRGFESTNSAVLINGIPVNDMENGRVYWSNWAGLADATGTIQVQRGLGASKLAIPSVGGTINIISKATDAKMGGSIFQGYGNNSYSKQTITLNTGLTENNFAMTLSLGQTSGDGFADGTGFKGYQYYLNLGKKLNEKHEITFTAVGAKQSHGQRQNRMLIEEFKNSPRGIRYNKDWGYKNGQVTWAEDNFYTKPLFSLNHYWKLSEKTELSTSAYASFGTGGGGGTQGETALFGGENLRDGQIDFDRIVDLNAANGVDGSLAVLRASRNDHNWYGALSSLSHDLTESITLLGGVDLRYYRGKHFTELTDLLGGSYFYDNTDDNNPDHLANVGDKILYNNDGVVLWEGVFAQAEYVKNEISAFVTLQASNTSYQRIDYFNYLDSDPEQSSDFYNFFGYGVKGGANYNLSGQHNVFANLGYFERAPFFNAVFTSFSSNAVNANAENEKILSFELGYGFRSKYLNANVNVYRTHWNDKAFNRSFPGSNGQNFQANILGVDAIHQGFELDFASTPIEKLTINGMLSLGDWRWGNNLENVAVYDEANVEVGNVSLFVKDTKVGGSAQTTAALSARYEILKGFRVGAEYQHYDNIYAQYDVLSRGSLDADGNAIEAWKMEGFGLVDLNASYKFSIGDKFNAVLSGNINNLFDTEYIKNAQDGSTHDYTTALVYFGSGRTWNLGLKINF